MKIFQVKRKLLRPVKAFEFKNFIRFFYELYVKLFINSSLKISNKDDSSTQGRVEIIEQLGPRAILTIQSGNQQITAVVDNEHLKQVTDKSSISINSHLEVHHYFETSTGNRLN